MEAATVMDVDHKQIMVILLRYHQTESADNSIVLP